ncbi:MAG: serpin family protein [Actinophytocola sp.]|uniref:serpin family protein n=1 Tax=Actinophytocola sp. TaxID=1872138 RepID=UPI003D6A86EA
MTDRAHLAYTLALHKAVAPDPARNVCWSPFSVASALGLVAHGARGMTRDELTVLLLGDKSGDLVQLGELLTRAGVLEPPRDNEDEPIIAVSNTLWTDESIEVLVPFVEELGRWSSGKVREAPFREAPGEARDRINVDVAKTTRDLIPELIPADAITADTRSALVNALYLKCGWRFPFTEGATRPKPFHAPGGTVEVPTMSLSERIGYAARDGWQVATLRAIGGVEAVVLLPDGDLADAEPDLDEATLADLLEAPKPTQVDLALPKFKVGTQAELTPPLNKLGVRTVFGNDADLSGISTVPLAVEAVLHESVLEIDEKGLEGAAATAVMMRLASLPSPGVELTVDRPFLLLVRHAATGVVYFVARVSSP